MASTIDHLIRLHAEVVNTNAKLVQQTIEQAQTIRTLEDEIRALKAELELYKSVRSPHGAGLTCAPRRETVTMESPKREAGVGPRKEVTRTIGEVIEETRKKSNLVPEERILTSRSSRSSSFRRTLKNSEILLVDLAAEGFEASQLATDEVTETELELGESANVDDHLHCRFCVHINCKYAKCAVRKCPDCKRPLHQCKLEDHLLICLKTFARCPNASYGCPARLRRDFVGAHLRHCCASVISCPMGTDLKVVLSSPRVIPLDVGLRAALHDQVCESERLVFFCKKNFRRDEFANHYELCHMGYEEVIARCPLSSNGCSFFYYRKSPKWGSLKYSPYLSTVVHCPPKAAILSIYTGMSLDEVPEMVLFKIAQYLDSGSLRCLSATSRRLRAFCFGKFAHAAMVLVRWEKSDRGSWKEKEHVWKFSNGQARIHEWTVCTAGSLKDHLSKCKFYIRNPHTGPQFFSSNSYHYISREDGWCIVKKKHHP